MTYGLSPFRGRRRLGHGVSWRAGAQGVSSPFSAAVARPTPTGTIVTVTTATPTATIASDYAGLNPGDCLEFDDGTYDQSACFPSGYWRQGVIIRAKNRGAYDADPMGGGSGIHWARFTRNVVFQYGSGLGGTKSSISANNITIHDIHHTTAAGLWPADNASWTTVCPAASSTWGFLNLAVGVSGFSTLYNEFSMGYGATKDPFDPTFKYPDCNSPATFLINSDGTISSPGDHAGWGDATWLTYNRLLHGPYAISGASSAVGSGLTIYGNYFHDLSHCLNGIVPSGGAFLLRHNWMQRSYHDFGTISTANTTPPASIEMAQNVWMDPTGNQFDNANPHVDTNQLFWSLNGGGSVRPANIRSSRNLLMSSIANIRAAAQFNFLQLSAGHYASGNDIIAIAPKLRENIGVMSGSAIGAALGVSEDFYVRGNEVWNPSTLSNGSTTVVAELSVDSVWGVSTAHSNKGLFADNVFEADPIADSGATLATMTKTNNAILGPHDARTLSEATVFSGDVATWPASPHAAFELRRKRAAYSTLGTAAPDIATFLLGDMDWTGERPFLGFVDAAGQTAGAAVPSNPAWIHGGDPGDLLAFDPKGLQWQLLAADRTTVLQTWSTTARNVAVDGGYIQLQTTAPAQGTTINFAPTLGGVAQPWNVGSASTAVYPIIAFAGGDDLYARSTGGLGPDGTFATVALMRFNMSAKPTASQTIYGSTSGGRISIQILTTGIIRVTLFNSAAGSFARAETSVNVCDGVTHDIIISIDTSQPTNSAGVSVYVDGSPASNTAAVWAAGIINYSNATATYQIGGVLASGNAANFAGQIGALYLNVATRVDLAANASKFNADQIGTNGTGPSGAQPVGFFVGNASQWNAASGINWGTGAKYIKQGTAAVTDVSGGIWS